MEDVVFKKKVLNEMLDKREYGLDFEDPNEFKLFVSENYDISEQEILDIWNSYEPSCEELEDFENQTLQC